MGMFEMFELGGAFIFGLLFSWCVLSIIYCIFDNYIDKAWGWIINNCKKIKWFLFGEPISPEPTVCEKLGDTIIWANDYNRIQDLKEQFDQEEQRVNTLIEFIFPAPQITYNKFSNDVTRLHNAFYKQYKSIHIYVRAYPYFDMDSQTVIHQAEDNLKNFLTSLKDLSKELAGLIVCDKSPDSLLREIKNESQSVKNYKE